MKMEFKPDKHMTQELSCYVCNISKYASETIDGKLCIIGKKKSNDKKLFTFEKLGSSYLLHSLLLLYEALDVHGNAIRPDEYDKTVTTSDLNKIMEWCTEHGLPFEDGYISCRRV